MLYSYSTGMLCTRVNSETAMVQSPVTVVKPAQTPRNPLSIWTFQWPACASERQLTATQAVTSTNPTVAAEKGERTRRVDPDGVCSGNIYTMLEPLHHRVSVKQLRPGAC